MFWMSRSWLNRTRESFFFIFGAGEDLREEHEQLHAHFHDVRGGFAVVVVGVQSDVREDLECVLDVEFDACREPCAT
jgi:hypothetical protein